jgi:hypothetical protein
MCTACDAEVKEIEGLARATHGHPMISGFDSSSDLSFVIFSHLCSTLATLLLSTWRTILVVAAALQ